MNKKKGIWEKMDSLEIVDLLLGNQQMRKPYRVNEIIFSLLTRFSKNIRRH